MDLNIFQFIRISICKMSECWICSYSLFQEVIDLSSRRKIAQPWNFWHNSLILNLNFYVWTLKAYTPNIQNRYLHFYILWKGGEQRSCRRWQVLPRTQGKRNRKEIPENSVKKSSSCISMFVSNTHPLGNIGRNLIGILKRKVLVNQQCFIVFSGRKLVLGKTFHLTSLSILDSERIFVLF